MNLNTITMSIHITRKCRKCGQPNPNEIFVNWVEPESYETVEEQEEQREHIRKFYDEYECFSSCDPQISADMREFKKLKFAAEEAQVELEAEERKRELFSLIYEEGFHATYKWVEGDEGSDRYTGDVYFDGVHFSAFSFKDDYYGHARKVTFYGLATENKNVREALESLVEDGFDDSRYTDMIDYSQHPDHQDA